MDTLALTEKREGLLRKKLWLSLFLDLLLCFLGGTSLYEKIFLLDGVIALRAFTVDGNLFTTFVSVIAVFFHIRELGEKKESGSRFLYFLELCSAVTEAVIFIIVMIGYLPFVPDTPKITPYHMFCLHVGIPVLAVARFILFMKPLGIVEPVKLLRGAIPIGVYGLFVIIAIKAGVLPTVFIPYSFLDFEHNYIWYFLFALFTIPGFGYLWAWIFYRLNMSAAALWYKKEETARLAVSRVSAMSRFDVVNSGITIVFSLLSILLLSVSLMIAGTGTAAVQQNLMGSISSLMLDEYDHYLNEGPWQIKNGALYKGDTFISDGTSEKDFYRGEGLIYMEALYVKASDLGTGAAGHGPDDYVAVALFTGGENEPGLKCGDMLDPDIVHGVTDSPAEAWYELIKLERPLTPEEELHKDQVRNTREAYYHYCMTFGGRMFENGVGILELYLPAYFMTDQIKAAEFTGNFFMALAILTVFAVLYIITYRWIRALEQSLDFAKALARGNIPDKPLDLGRRARRSSLSAEYNAIREEKLKARDGKNTELTAEAEREEAGK